GDSRSGAGFEAFRWTEQTGMVGLGDLPGGAFESTAYDVTPDGSVVVGEGDPGGPINPSAAFRWEGGVMTRLPDLPGDEDRCGAHAVSADGRTVAGWGINAADRQEAARWVDGAAHGLGFPEGATGTVAFDLSADGRVAVGTAFTPGGTSAFIWTEGAGMAFIPDLPGGSPYREARAVSGDGRVAVGVGDSGAAFEVFIWTAETGTRSLKAVLESHGLDLTGWALTSVWSHALSHDGRVVVGSGRNPEGVEEAWRAVLPPWPHTGTAEPPGGNALTLSASPNPARARATVRLTLTEAQHVRVAVYDALGREVAVLNDGPLAGGLHTLSLNTSGLPSGVYLVRVEAGGAALTRRLTVAR
ncbi:MAG TPA: T9SS type A sorting domain-containing protein, partial [Rubricoccaceae bacterium]|nr:T9SS type A sorting domain-containing protein [Rubricoccaceae bacterium]